MENETTEQVSVKDIAIKWGLIYAVVSIFIALVLQMTGLAAEQWAGWVNLPFSIAFIYLAHKAFKDEGDGFMSYGQGLGLGTLVNVIASILGSIFSYIYIAFIDDSIIQIAKDRAYEQWEAQGMSDAQIETAEGVMDFMMAPPMMALMGLIAGIFFGFILSLIVSIFTKNSREELS